MVEWISFHGIAKKIDAERLRMEENGTAGEQIGEWLLASESEESPSNLDVLVSRFASAMVGNINRVEAGMKSGEVRHLRAIDSRVLEAVKTNNPDIRVATRILEELGLGDLTENQEDLKYVLEKYGGMLGMGNNGNPMQRSQSRSQYKLK